jgi:dTMP kinase
MLISFEGLPGSGKTTQSGMLAERLRSQSMQVTCLPDLITLDAGDLCSRLVALFESSGDPFMRHGNVFTDTYLAAAIRADITATLIDPALRAGHIVIEDRGVHTMYSCSLASVLRHHDCDTSLEHGAGVIPRRR